MSSRIRLDDSMGPGGSDPEPQREPAEPAERVEAPPATPAPERPSEAPREPSPEDADEPLSPAAQKRIDRLNYERHEARRQLAEMRAQHQQLMEAMQRGQQPPPSDDYRRGLYEAEQQRVASEFNRACDDLFSRGVQEYGQEMGEARDRLNAVGWGNRPDALAALTRLRGGEGHRVYRELSRDLDRAARILSLDPVSMMEELTDIRYSLGGGGEPQPRESGAPYSREPVRHIGGRSQPPRAFKLDDPNTKMSDWIREREKNERRSRILR